MRLLAPAFLAFSFVTCSFHAQTIGPLSLGMTAAQAAQALGPGYKDTLRMRGDDSGVIVHTFMKANDEYSFQTIDGRAFFIGHSTLFETGAQPGLQDTKQRLLAKYGPVSTTGNTGSQMTWDFDKAGIHRPSLSPCYARLAKVDGTDMNNRATGAFLQFVVGVETTAPCYTRVTVDFNPVSGKDLLQGLEVEMWNLQDYLTRLRELARARQQKQQQIDDASRKAAKAPL